MSKLIISGASIGLIAAIFTGCAAYGEGPSMSSYMSDTKGLSEISREAPVPQPAPQVATPICDMTSVNPVLSNECNMHISVIGQGVSPVNTVSPAQAYALAKRAAVADGYRLIAEKVRGVRVDGDDLIKNMMVTRSTIRTSVQAMIRNANVAETTFKEGLCEVEMEVIISRSQFAQ